MAVLVALTISATTELAEPVHWYSQPSSLHASSAPYWVGVKNGLVVTWLTKTNFHFGVLGKLPMASAFLESWSPQAASRPVAASAAPVRPVPVSSRRRVVRGRLRVSTARSTWAGILLMITVRC
jgi:hypothetical protein